MAVLIVGEVVIAPVLRVPISTSARITGSVTRAEAERIVNGIGITSFERQRLVIHANVFGLH